MLGCLGKKNEILQHLKTDVARLQKVLHLSKKPTNGQNIIDENVMTNDMITFSLK